jgi:hypothetical protein
LHGVDVDRCGFLGFHMDSPIGSTSLPRTK